MCGILSKQLRFVGVVTNNNLEFGHIVCQPIRSLQVGPDLPDKSHVSVNDFFIIIYLFYSNYIDFSAIY